MPKITKQFIDEIQAPETGQKFYRDDDIRGFAVRATKNSNAYIFEKRVNGKTCRIALGNCDAMTLEAAKRRACELLGDLAKGIDPKTGKRINVLGDITLLEVLNKFLDTKPIREATKRNYHYAVKVHFHDWLDKPITSITKDMVEERHRHLTEAPNRLGTSSHGRANNALKKLSTLINFAADRFGTDDKPLIASNPVDRLSRNRSWHRIHPRRRIIQDKKLQDWYRGVCALQNEVARDFLKFLLFTGMRFGESRKLKWEYVDFKENILTVPREIVKTDKEHRLPLSNYLVTLLRQRYIFRGQSEWVFQSVLSPYRHLSDGAYIVQRVRALSGVEFTYHDLRRTFLSMAEKLEVPHYVIKRLANHSDSNDVTGQYLTLDIERLRMYMTRISDAFAELLNANSSQSKPGAFNLNCEIVETMQLRIPQIDDYLL